MPKTTDSLPLPSGVRLGGNRLNDSVRWKGVVRFTGALDTIAGSNWRRSDLDCQRI